MKSNDNNLKSWWQPGLVLFLKLSSWIGSPIIIALFLGKWLDIKYDTEPWLFLTTMAVAFVISIVGMIKETSREIKRIEQEEKIKKNNKD